MEVYDGWVGGGACRSKFEGGTRMMGVRELELWYCEF